MKLIKTIFSIPKMDCPSEERIIRMKLEEFQGIRNLDFTIPERKLSIIHEGSSEEILEALRPLNFGTKILSSSDWNEVDAGISKTSDKDEASLLRKLLIINALMFFVEFTTGLVADSMGLISDSLDMLADASVYLISLYAVGKVLAVKKKSARINGIFQLVLGFGVLIETIRKFLMGSEPEPSYMILISLIALAANVYCLYLLSSHKEGEVHMKASYICSSTDVMANMGVVLAGVAVFLTGSAIPDLVAGVIVTFIVLRGAMIIIRIS